MSRTARRVTKVIRLIHAIAIITVIILAYKDYPDPEKDPLFLAALIVALAISAATFFRKLRKEKGFSPYDW